MTAVSTATVLALAPFAVAQNNNGDQDQKRIQDLERQVEQLKSTVQNLLDQQARTPSTDDLDRAIADLASRIEAKGGMFAKGGPNVSAPDVRAIKLKFEERFRAEWYGDRTFGAKKNDPISPSPLMTNVSPFAPNGQINGSFIGGGSVSVPNTMADDAMRVLNRARINIDVDVNEKMAAFFQIQHSQIWGTPIGNGAAAGGSLLPNAPNTDLIAVVPPGSLGEQLQAPASSGALGFKQANVTFKNVYDTDAQIMIGRFNLELGQGRLLSSADYDNVGRSFDGLKVDWSNDNVALTGVFAKIVQGGLDFQNQDTNLVGVWAKLSPVKEFSITPYTLWVDNNTTNSSAMVGKPWTIGAFGDFNVVDTGLKFNGELALQLDHERPNTPVPGAHRVDFFEAYMWSVGAEYEVPIEDAKKYRPMIGIEFIDGSKLFNDLYGKRHGISGLTDIVTSLNNLRQWKVYGGVTPWTDIDLRASFYFMRLDEDAGEGALGQPTLSKNLGQELDVELWSRCSDHVTVGIGWGHFFNQYALQEGAYSPGAAWATSLSRSADTRRDADAFVASLMVTF
jgi:hypothetical protein